MRTPVKAERCVSVIRFGIGYYIPVNVYERLHARWESMLDDLRFRVFVLRDRRRYVRKRRRKAEDREGGGPVNGHS